MTRGRKPNILINDIRQDFCEEWFGRDEPSVWPLWIDDIVSGIARLDWYGEREQQIPLSTSSIIQCFIHLDEISTRNIQELLNMGKRQAERYNKACRLAHPFLKRSLASEQIKRTRYPQISIVSYEHGLALGYGSEWGINDA